MRSNLRRRSSVKALPEHSGSQRVAAQSVLRPKQKVRRECQDDNCVIRPPRKIFFERWEQKRGFIVRLSTVVELLDSIQVSYFLRA